MNKIVHIGIFFAVMLFFYSKPVFSQCSAAIGSSISPLEGCDGMTIQFNDISSGVVQQRVWDFGDGSPTSGAQNPIHSYNSGVISDTTYIISLSITCLGGSTDIFYDTVTVFSRPDVQFSTDTNTVCAIADSICFDNLSDTGPGFSFQWSFGDFTGSALEDPCHIFSTSGSYDIQLTVTSDKGCQNSLLKSDFITVINAPSPDFSLSTFSGCNPLTVNISNTSDTSVIAISNWSWNFGDGSPVNTTFNPGSHTFYNPDTFLITLFATNTLGCSNTTTKAMVVKETPTATFTTTTPVCVSEPLLVTYTGTGGSGATFSWNFSGGTPGSATGMGPHSVSWSNSGTKTISLLVDMNGCVASGSQSVFVNPNPIVFLFSSLINDSICEGETGSFTVLPSVYTNYSFSVNLVELQNSTDNVFQYSEFSNGDIISVIATDINGCLNTKADTVYVTPSPAVVLSSSLITDTLCQIDTVIISASPSGYANYIFYDDYVQIQSGTSNTLTLSNIDDSSFIFVKVNNVGCSFTSDSLFLTVSQPLDTPTVNCGTSTNNSLEFLWDDIAGSSGYEVSINGDTFSNPNSGSTGLSHSVSGLLQGDSVIISVFAEGGGPCGNSDTVQHTCYAMPCNLISFSKSPDTTICINGYADLFISNISASSYTTIWGYGSPSMDTSFSFFPLSEGDTSISVSLIDLLQPGCPPTTSNINITVTPYATIVLSTSVSSDSICIGQEVSFTALPAGYGIYDFYNAYQLVQSGPNNIFSITNLESGDSITVIAYNEGCVAPVASSASSVVVSPLPVPQVNCGTTTNNSIEFVWDAISWSLGYEISINGGSFIVPGSGQTGLLHLVSGLNPGDAVAISVLALGNSPCGNSEISLPVTCYSSPCNAITFNKSADTTICAGNSITLGISNVSSPDYSVIWNGGAATSTTTQTFIPDGDTIISITVVDSTQMSCPPPTKYINVVVNAIPVVSLSGSLTSDSVCSDAEIIFTASPTGYDDYSFYSGYALLQDGPNPQFTANGLNEGDSILVIASDNGCTSLPGNGISYAVINPLPAPQVNCGTSTNNSIEFIWDEVIGSSGYEVSVNGGSFFTPSSGPTGLLHNITSLSAGDTISVSVLATASNPCGNGPASVSTICYANPCTAITFSKSDDTMICAGENIDIGIFNISAGNFSVVWSGGTPTGSTSQVLSPLFDTAIWVSVIDSAQLSCPSPTKYINVIVNQNPVVSLSGSLSSDSICSDEGIVFTATPVGFDDYSYYSGYALLQNGANPQFFANGWSNGDSLLVVATDKGCSGPPSNQLIFTVIDPLPAPQVNCGASTNNSIEFTWDPVIGSLGYEVSVNGSNFITPSSGPAGLSHDITGIPQSDSVTINVIALGNFPCGNSPVSITAKCYAIQCSAVTFNKTNDTALCEGGNVDVGIFNISSNNYSVIWNGGTATSSITQTIVPLNDTVISVSIIDSTQLNCPVPTKYINILVNPIPTISLSSSFPGDSICNDEEIIFSASPSGYDEYIFYSGYGMLQGGANHQFSSNGWTDGDSILVIATDKGCTSQPSNQLIFTAIDPLPAPQVNCGTSTNNSIGFIWDPVIGSMGYEVSVNGGNFITPNSGTNGLAHDLSGFNQGDSVTISVHALGVFPCGNSPVSITETCYAIQCSAVTFNKTNDTILCEGENVEVGIFNISSNNFSVIWNGGTATSSITQTIVTLNDTVISVSVIDSAQLSCPSPTKYINVIVNQNPVVSLSGSIPGDSICSSEEIIFSANPSGYDDYSFYSGYALLQNGANPQYTANGWSNGDSLFVVATDIGCSGQPSNQIIFTVIDPLPAPQVNCGTSTGSSIEFIWDSVSGSLGYEVSVNGGGFISPSSGTNGLLHDITGLNQGDSMTISVVAIGPLPCGNSIVSSIATCFAISCNAVSFAQSNDTVICAGDSVDIEIFNISAGSYSVIWNGGATVLDTIQTIVPFSNTIISVSVIDSSQLNCPAPTKYINILVNPIPAISLSSSFPGDSICNDEEIIFSASPSGYDEYIFYSGYGMLQGGANHQFSSNGWTDGDSILVIATDKGCTSQSSNQIIYAVTDPLLTPQVNCGTSTNSSIEFIWDAVIGNLGYQVSVNGGNFITPSSGINGLFHYISGLNQGDSMTLSVEAFGANPCGNSQASITATCFAIPCNAVTFSMSSDTTICTGGSADFGIFNISANIFSVIWSGGAATSVTTQTLIPVGDTVISVSVIDSAQLNCPSPTKYISIQVNPIPVVSLSSSVFNDSICEGGSITFTASPAGYFNYSFFYGSDLLQSSDYPIFIFSSVNAGNNISVVTNNSGCSDTSNIIQINVIPTPVVSLSSSALNDSICIGNNVVYSALPSGFTSYQFYNGSLLVQDSSINTFTNPFVLASDSINVFATNFFGCMSSPGNYVVLAVSSPPVVAISCSDPDSTICAGDTVSFSAVGTNVANYFFYNNAVFIYSSQTGLFFTDSLINGNSISVVGAGMGGCPNDTSNGLSIMVKEIPQPVVFSEDTLICIGSAVKLYAVDSISNLTTFLWNSGQANDTINICPLASTCYCVLASLNGCTGKSDTVCVSVDDIIPNADAGSDVVLCKGESIQLNASGGKTYLWSPFLFMDNKDIPNPEVSPEDTMVYTVTVYNDACFSTDSVKIIIDRCLSEIINPIPQVISPNGDGINDVWEIPDVDYFPDNTLTIFNRWGNVVFHAQPYQNTWDGTSGNGGKLPDGTYYFILVLGNDSKPSTGFIMIHR